MPSTVYKNGDRKRELPLGDEQWEALGESVKAQWGSRAAWFREMVRRQIEGVGPAGMKAALEVLRSGLRGSKRAVLDALMSDVDLGKEEGHDTGN